MIPRRTRSGRRRARRWGLAVLASIALAGGGWPVLAQPPTVPRLQVLRLEQGAAERAYFGLLDAPPAPSERLLELRRESEAVAAAIAQNYALRDGYATGRIPAPAAEQDPDAWRARVAGIISNAIHAQERTLRATAAEIPAVEHAELVQPVVDARDRYDAATRELEEGLRRFAVAQGPLSVRAVSVLDAAGAPRFVGTWDWAFGGETEQRVVALLEAALRALRQEVDDLHVQNVALAEDLHFATLTWNASRAMLAERADDRAVRDLVVQALQNGVEIGVSFATGGIWTVGRVVFTVGDLSLRAHASHRAFDGVSAVASDSERDHLGAAMRHALAERIADDLAAGRKLDVQALLDGREALPTTPAGATVVGAVSVEAAKSAVAGLIAAVETGLDRAGTFEADRLAAAAVALTRGVPAAGLVEATAAVRLERETLAAATAQLQGLRVSLAAMAGAGAVSWTWDLFATVGEPTDAELARSMALGELRIFLLAEAYRQSRALYDERVAVMKELADELPLARRRVAVVGRRAFVDGAGAALDREASIPLAVPTGPVRVQVDLEVVREDLDAARVDRSAPAADPEAARVPWRVEVWHVAGDRRYLLATARAPAGAVRATTPSIPRERLPAAVASGPPAALVVRVVSERPGDQDVDADPSTPAWLEAASLAWRGWEAGPDEVRFHLVGVPLCGTVPITSEGTLCRCAGGAASGSVWGSDLYTDDSAVCAAAVHAGALVATPGAGGELVFDGVVEVRRTGGCGAYGGSSANGVVSRSFGGWGGSIYFPAVQSGLCEEGNPPPAGAWYCPRNAEGVLALALACQCTSLATREGAVWGTTEYTSDSSVCRAALHAGRVGPAGGTVEVVLRLGRDRYEGSTRNGVDSSSYGSWPTSFGFR